MLVASAGRAAWGLWTRDEGKQADPGLGFLGFGVWDLGSRVPTALQVLFTGDMKGEPKLNML